MIHYKTPKPKPRVIVRMIDELLVLLGRYRGGKIVKHKHPIHRKVVELERLLRVNDNRKRQQQILPYPLSKPWFRMLYASREQRRYMRHDRIDQKALDRMSYKDCAWYWGVVFATMLKAFRNLVTSGEYQRVWERAKSDGGDVCSLPGVG